MKYNSRFIGGIIVLFLVLLIQSCQSFHKPLFKKIPSSVSGITFSNTITQSDSLNMLNYQYMFNGGGVAVADFNKDGLPDLYFTGNMVSNRLYLNKGHFKFKDVTKQSHTGGEGKWCSGVSVIDINNDGWPDLYVCATESSNPDKRKNILYVNQGLNKNGVPVFKDEAAQYGLADTTYTTDAAFFDYDGDGDLDVYMLTSGKGVKLNRYSGVDGGRYNIDELYQNNWNDNLHHAYFTNVSKKAGITSGGFGLGVNITDINNDGKPDIYVTDDYLSNDKLWINNGNGTFSDKASKYFKHTSFSAMGNDVEDINNDGKPDVIALDMFPPDNLRKKTMTDPNNYMNEVHHAFKGHATEYTRNTLQLNDGRAVLSNDSLGHPVFSDISFLTGIAQTDWSWTPLVADFTNNGYRDIFITNGIPGDITDGDFATYRGSVGNIASFSTLMSHIPKVKISNYAFENNGSLHFTKVTKKWGLSQPSYSNGAVWADLNNDGALDMIVNNIDGKAFVYENTANNKRKANNHWIEVKFRGNKKNTLGLGATADIYYDNGQKHQTYYNTLYRGYLSSVQDMAHFGLGKYTTIDSLVISWPDRKKQVWKNLKTDQILIAKEQDARRKSPQKTVLKKLKQKPFFTDVTHDRDIHYVQKENKFNDFRLQGVLPHKFSQYGPGLAVGDIDGNGEEDLFIGGSYHHKGKFLLQQKDGKFTLKDLLPGKSGNEKKQEDEGVLLFDANNDGLPDLFVVSGGDESPRGSKNYEDRLYINEGHGKFKYDPNALPPIHESGSCVIAADYNHDGYLDLFVGGRVAPGHYPSPVSSHILRNDTKNGKVKFTDVTKSVAKPLTHIGLVTDALWTDFNNDGWPDLIISGEWMPVTFLENEHGKFVNITKKTGIGNKIGWWNSIVGGDFNNDGRTDYIVGNLGLNSLYKASDKYPVSIYANDFAHNGLYEAITTQYYPDSKDQKREYPVERKDILDHQLLQISHKFPTDHSFGKATIHDILNKKDLKNALTYHANMFQTCLIENKGHGKFTIKSLPIEAQFAPVFGMVTGDFNNDGHLDVVLNGNESGIEPQIGNYDAFNGLLLLGNGKGKFTSEPMDKSGIYIPGDGKALVKLIGAKGNVLMAGSQNQGPLKMYKLNKKRHYIHLKREDSYAIIHYKNGSIRKEEFYYGSSFLSDSGRFMSITPGMKSVTIVNYKGEKRKIMLK